MTLLVLGDGSIRSVYGEAIELAALGDVRLRRAGHLEPDSGGQWWADLTAVNGPVLGPFERRSDALTAESRWLDEHWLESGGASENTGG